MKASKSFVFILFIFVNTEAANILAYYPFPSISHQIVFRPITLELIKRGHNVTVITPDPIFKKEESPANLKEIDVHDVSYSTVKKQYTASITGSKKDLINQTKLVTVLPAILLEEQFKEREASELLQYKDDAFDLILLEAYPAPTLGLTYKFRAPTILFSSLSGYPGNYETLGAPTYWPIYQDIFRQRYNSLTLLEKVQEYSNRYIIQRIIDDGEEEYNVVLRKVFGPGIPPLSALRNNVDMLFVNVHPIWEGNYPMPPGVIHLGGLHQKPAKELPRDLQQYLDSSVNGVVYISFGSNVKPSQLPPEKLAIFQNVLSQIPYDILWKWDSDNFTGNANNIRTFKWLPQADLLRHPKIKLFISQGGMQSTDEAITAGVPLICVPMFGDQWYNCEKYVQHRIGVRLDLDVLTEDKLRRAVTEVTENESYRRNIVRLRTLIQDQPQTPLERGMWWIEYVLRHKGAKHLRAPAANMSWTEYLELELVCVILLTSFVTLVLVYLVVRYVISLVVKVISKRNKLKKT